MIKKIICSICDCKFDIDKKKKYIVKRAALVGEPILYDAIDCPNCGCQKILQTRMKSIKNMK